MSGDEPSAEARLTEALNRVTARLEALEANSAPPAVQGEATKPGAAPIGVEPAHQALAAIDRRIAEAMPEDVLFWLRARAEIVRQETFFRDS
jgi:hypothetical protein